jgi:hypothetical protein
MLKKHRFPKNKLFAFSSILVITASLISLFIILFASVNNDYRFLIILPIVFSFCYVFLLGRILFESPKIFIMVLIPLNFIRYVILPALVAYTGYYGGRASIPPELIDYKLAVFLMAYEILVLSFVIFFFSQKYSSDLYDYRNKVFKVRKKIIYYIFILLVMGLVIINPKIINQFSFILPSEKALNIYGNYAEYSKSTGALFKLTAYLFNILKELVLILLVYMNSKKYQKSGKNIYFYIAILFGVMNIAIYFGANRSDLLLQSFATILLLLIFFKDKKFKILFSTGIISLMMIIILSIGRQHHVLTSKDILNSIADTLQIYLGGPYNVAIAIDMADKFSEFRSIITIIGDFTRSVFGLSFLVKQFEIPLSTDIFNWRIFQVKNNGTQILPMIGQGYFYFGFIFSPILEIIFIYIAFTLEKVTVKTQDPVLYYFLIITCIRLGFLTSQNTVIQLNDLSYNLFIPLILIFLNNRIVYKKNSKMIDR